MKVSKFAVGRRWRVLPGVSSLRGCEADWFDFLIVGPADHGDPAKGKMCRLEVKDHSVRCNAWCSHGVEQTYPHAHLKKYGFLVGEEAPYNHANQKPGWTCLRDASHDGPCALVPLR